MGHATHLRSTPRYGACLRNARLCRPAVTARVGRLRPPIAEILVIPFRLVRMVSADWSAGITRAASRRGWSASFR